MPYADSVAPDPFAHPCSLIWELHCPLFCELNYIDLSADTINNFQARLRVCAGWSWASLSAYGMWQMFAYGVLRAPVHSGWGLIQCIHRIIAMSDEYSDT